MRSSSKTVHFAATRGAGFQPAGRFSIGLSASSVLSQPKVNSIGSSSVKTAGVVLLGALLGLGLAAPDGSGALERGQAAFRRGDWAEAEKNFLAAVREKPKSPTALKWLGMVYTAEEKFELAEPPFRSACEIDPREELACYYLGRADYALSRYEESRSAFEKALRYQPGSTRIERGMGLTLEALGRAAEAERYLKEAAAGSDKDALSDYGQFLFRQGRLKESVAVLERSGDRANLERVVRALGAVPGEPAANTPAAAIRFSAKELPMIVRNGAIGEMHQVETMIESGRAPYPVERTLLISGVLESCLDSKLQAHRRLDTPYLAVRYQPPRDLCFCRS